MPGGLLNLISYGNQLNKDLQTLGKSLQHLLGYLQKSNPDRYLADGFP